MLVSFEDLSVEALDNIVLEYIYSNVSDTESELDVSKWKEAVLSQVKKGQLLIEYSETNQSVYLKSPEELNIS